MRYLFILIITLLQAACFNSGPPSNKIIFRLLQEHADLHLSGSDGNKTVVITIRKAGSSSCEELEVDAFVEPSTYKCIVSYEIFALETFPRREPKEKEALFTQEMYFIKKRGHWGLISGFDPNNVR